MHVADNGAALLQDTAWRGALKEEKPLPWAHWLVPLSSGGPERAFQLSVTSTFDMLRGSASAGMCTAACSPFPFSMVPPAREAQHVTGQEKSPHLLRAHSTAWHGRACAHG
jgi:hypothetical protein